MPSSVQVAGSETVHSPQSWPRAGTDSPREILYPQTEHTVSPVYPSSVHVAAFALTVFGVWAS